MTRALLALLLCGCSTVPHRTVNIPDGCHVNAVAFRNASIAAKAVSGSKVMVVRWPGKTTLHAYCAYQHAGFAWVYDNRSGSWKVSRDLTLLADPNRLARAIDPYSSGYFE